MLSTKTTFFDGFVMGQNQPETRSSRQIQQFYQFSQPLKTGLKHDAVVKTCVFDTFFAGPKSPETRIFRRKMMIFSPAIVYEGGIFN